MNPLKLPVTLPRPMRLAALLAGMALLISTAGAARERDADRNGEREGRESRTERMAEREAEREHDGDENEQVIHVRSDDRRPGPRLRLAPDRVVQPGERVHLQWVGADASIRELEIMLSVDGGETYPIWVSPSLDPATGGYDWRVPRLGSGPVWLRVRFNRDGREIEGEPVRLATFLAHGLDLPLAAMVPGTNERESERTPRSGGSRDDASARAGVGPCETNDGLRRARRLEPSGAPVVDVNVSRPFGDAASAPASPHLDLFIPPRE